MRRKLALIFCTLFFSAHAYAATIEQPLADPVQEQQARALFHELRCMVCEGQSLAESDATLAVQMRAHVRTMLADGKSPAEIETYFRASYGERILMTPPFEDRTAMLWITPLFLFLLGATVLWRFTRPAKEPHA